MSDVTFSLKNENSNVREKNVDKAILSTQSPGTNKRAQRDVICLVVLRKMGAELVVVGGESIIFTDAVTS